MERSRPTLAIACTTPEDPVKAPESALPPSPTAADGASTIDRRIQQIADGLRPGDTIARLLRLFQVETPRARRWASLHRDMTTKIQSARMQSGARP